MNECIHKLGQGMCINCAPWMFPNPPTAPVSLPVDPRRLMLEVDCWVYLSAKHGNPDRSRERIADNVARGMRLGTYLDWSEK